MRPSVALATLILTGLFLSGLLSGCGQKGDLYLPDEAAPASAADKASAK